MAEGSNRSGGASPATLLLLDPILPGPHWVWWAHLFFNRPLKSSSPASSDFPSPLWPLRGGMNSTEVLLPQTYPESPTAHLA